MMRHFFVSDQPTNGQGDSRRWMLVTFGYRTAYTHIVTILNIIHKEQKMYWNQIGGNLSEINLNIA